MPIFTISIAQVCDATGYTRERQRHFRNGNPARKEAAILIERVHYIKQSNGGVMYSAEAIDWINEHKKAATPGRKRKLLGD